MILSLRHDETLPCFYTSNSDDFCSIKSKPAIVHKDVKPDNILVDSNYTRELCDLGISKFTEMPNLLKTTIDHNFQGTPFFMAPDILIQNRAATTASDVWSLVGVIVELYSKSKLWSIKDCQFGGLQGLK
ncbi:dual specificity protein kinase shkA-like [Chelonus insularis]|uniref:dual specificity protein kinase shkA-like n=1 Tax=Chelonus insularis TaxID=460826 RepID=UPI00158BAF6B|nr:dual specificity protein kinase shkA-like [Chelonus insularis]